MTGIPRGRILAMLVGSLLTLGAFPASGGAADGFDKLTWGMTRADVSGTYPGQTVETDSPKYRPEETDGTAVRIAGSSVLFEQQVQMECHFTRGKLTVIRLRFVRERWRNVEKVLAWYSPHSGDPLRSVVNKGSRKSTTWSWPSEGIELRSVREDDEIRYQRLDFSDGLRRRWRSADAAICSILPKSSSCAFPDRFCKARLPDSSGRGQEKETVLPIEVSGQASEVTCGYDGEHLRKVRLRIPKANNITADWVQRILDRRLGPSMTSRDDRNSRAVRLTSRWQGHPVELIVTREAKVRTKKGWTGPVESLSIIRTLSEP